MPELPEVYRYADQLEKELMNHTITDVKVFQEKCLNIPQKEFVKAVVGKKVDNVTSKGKWIFMNLSDQSRILINLGMGGEMLYLDNIPHEKYQVHLEFGKMFLSFHFWWFGYVHYQKPGEAHKLTDSIGRDYLRDNVTKDEFVKILKDRRGAIKSFLLNQKYLSGIGNYYIHDILYQARLHPNRPINTINAKELERLYDVIINEFKTSLSKNAFYYELDIYGNKGGFLADKIAYKEGQKCECGDTIIKIKTGSTSSYICPSCQKI